MFNWLTSKFGDAAIYAFIGIMVIVVSKVIGTSEVFTIVGAVVVAVSAIWASYQTAMLEKNVKVKNNTIIELDGSIAYTLTGGDSFCYVSPAIPEKSRVGQLMLIHKGDYPLYDVQIQITDLEKLRGVIREKSDSITFTDIFQCSTIKNFKSIKPSTSTVIGGMELPAYDDELEFFITIISRNGFITENLSFKKANLAWRYTLRVIRNDEILHEEIEPSYSMDDISISPRP